MTETEAKVIAAWQEAASDLGFRFTSPFAFTAADGRQHAHLGLVHDFGRRMGTLIAVLDEPSERVPRPAGDDFFHSILGESYARYERQLFIDTLNDWQYFGSEATRPSWYTGESWTSP